MIEEFNFNQLKDVYREAYKSDDKTLEFELTNGRGHFLFVMLLSEEDKDAQDNLFIFLRHVNKIIKLKLYGSHKNGDFKAYIKDEDQLSMIQELQLDKSEGVGKAFDFKKFLGELNNSIPHHIPVDAKIKTLRENRVILPKINAVDDTEKTVYDGTMQLERGVKSPRDKTLRKLYAYTDSNPAVIADFIEELKERNMTIRWTTPDKDRHLKIGF